MVENSYINYLTLENIQSREIGKSIKIKLRCSAQRVKQKYRYLYARAHVCKRVEGWGGGGVEGMGLTNKLTLLFT